MLRSIAFRSLLAAVVLSLPLVAPGYAQFGTLSVQYQYPMNGALAISRQTNIIIRPGDIINAATVKSSLILVTGSFSGKHSGILKLSDDKKTLVFTPYYSFTYSERVTVKLLDGIKTAAGQSVPAYSFYFTIQSQPKWGKTALQSIDNGSDDPVRPSPWESHPTIES